MALSWEPRGKLLGTCPFGRLEPSDVLYELDSPMIFVFLHDGHDHLAYMCGETTGLSRFIIVPTSPRIVDGLRTGAVTVREAIDQPWCWCLDVQPNGTTERCWVTSISELPDNALPSYDVLLDPHLEPAFSIRVEGRHLGRDNVQASVIKRAVDGAYIALKKLSEKPMSGTAGRPPQAWKLLFDLPAQRIEFGSFGISFGYPRISQESLLDRGGAKQQLDGFAADLSSALTWAVAPDQSSPPQLNLLEAMQKLVPPTQGPIEIVRIGGRILGPSVPPYVLDRKVTRKVRDALAKARSGSEQMMTLKGEARELDKDKMSFRLHISSAGDDYTCQFEEGIYDDVLDAFALDQLIEVTLRLKKGSRQGEVVAISAIADGDNPHQEQDTSTS